MADPHPRKITKEERFEWALRRIATSMTPQQLRRQSELAYGLEYEEVLEMAYENIQGEAKTALKGVRKTKLRAASAPPPEPPT